MVYFILFIKKNWEEKTKLFESITGAPAGGGATPPPETGKNGCIQMVLFSRLYKMTKVKEDGIENG